MLSCSSSGSSLPSPDFETKNLQNLTSWPDRPQNGCSGDASENIFRRLVVVVAVVVVVVVDVAVDVDVAAVQS